MQYTYGGTPADVLTDSAGNVIPDHPVLVRVAGTGQQVTALYESDGTTPIAELRSDPATSDRPGAIRAFRVADVAEIEYEYTGESGRPVRRSRTGREVPAEALATAGAALPEPATAAAAGDALPLGTNGQAVPERLASAAAVSPWSALEAAPAPRWVAHRGGSLLAPENTIEAMRSAVALNADAIEIDVYKVADGGLFVMHDTTVDRTSNLSGATSQLTTPGALRGRIDAGAWFANSWPNDLRVPLFADVLAEIGNTVPIIVHCNNAGSGQAAVDEIRRQELDDSVLVMAWTEAELTAARAAGIPTLLLDEDGILPSQTHAQLLASGTGYLGVDYRKTSNATIQAAAAAGLRVCVYTVNRRTDYAKLPKDDSVWAVISDDPWYVRGTAPMRSSSLFGAQTFFHGMVGIADAGDYRGFFQQTGGTSYFGLDASGTAMASNGGYASVLQGYAGPLPETCTIDFDYVLDVADYATASLHFTLTVDDAQYDEDATGTSARANGYNVLVRSNGTIDLYRNTGGTATRIGTLATAAITAGTAQHLRIRLTATQITVTRTNIAAPNALTVTDSTYRTGLYPHLGVRDTKTRWANLAITP
ncbi:glycerophosphodiester phosphodiesterase [Streptomyces sp. NPDC059701]|uniref:glycerophosphodiester phosphodiesterase n=1 Tax=Streptomyces sp. NPDC059701 TaxID=3346914 RepID=UPI0036A42A98